MQWGAIFINATHLACIKLWRNVSIHADCRQCQNAAHRKMFRHSQFLYRFNTCIDVWRGLCAKAMHIGISIFIIATEIWSMWWTSSKRWIGSLRLWCAWVWCVVRCIGVLGVFWVNSIGFKSSLAGYRRPSVDRRIQLDRSSQSQPVARARSLPASYWQTVKKSRFHFAMVVCNRHKTYAHSQACAIR